MDLAALLDKTPSLSRFSALLKEQGISPTATAQRYSTGQRSPSGELGGGGGRISPDESLGCREDSISSAERVYGGNATASMRGGPGGGCGGIDGDGNGNGNDAKPAFFTVFAPTNNALDHLEAERPWLFQNSSSFRFLDLEGGLYSDPGGRPAAGAGGNGARGARESGGAGLSPRGLDGWSPIRELLAYHLVPGVAQYSRCVFV